MNVKQSIITFVEVGQKKMDIKVRVKVLIMVCNLCECLYVYDF